MIVLSLFCNTYETLRLQFEESIFIARKYQFTSEYFCNIYLLREVCRDQFLFNLQFALFLPTGLSINQLYVGDIIPSFRACRITFLVTEVLVSKR